MEIGTDNRKKASIIIGGGGILINSCKKIILKKMKSKLIFKISLFVYEAFVLVFSSCIIGTVVGVIIGFTMSL